VSEQIHGRVVDGAGRAVADATVMVVQALAPVPDIAAVSDEHGRFVFTGLPAGTYRLRAVGPDGDEGETDVTVPRPEAGLIRLGTGDMDDGQENEK
jgi:protocatechuate 3,4-dioxygenase beta subunit